jgi:hypothetical protein
MKNRSSVHDVLLVLSDGAKRMFRNLWQVTAGTGGDHLATGGWPVDQGARPAFDDAGGNGAVARCRGS